MKSIDKEFEDFVLAEMGDVAVVNGDRYDSPKIQAYYKVWLASRESISKENRSLRRSWCARSSTRAYMDDGEASDSSVLPSIDFLREPIRTIQTKLMERAIASLGESTLTLDGLRNAESLTTLNLARLHLCVETFCAYLIGLKPTHEALVLMVTTAYEQGVGKGHQAVLYGRDVSNPWGDTLCKEAWDLGFAEGKDQAVRMSNTKAGQ